MSLPSDAEIQTTAGCAVLWRLHEVPGTREVWFIDAERRHRYFDGTAVIPFDWQECEEAGEKNIEMFLRSARLMEFAAGWVVEDRTLCIGEYAYREITRCDDRLIGKIYRGDPAIKRHTFTMQCASVDAAMRVFRSMAQHPLAGCSVVDPFYIEGSGELSGVIVRKVNASGARARFLWRFGRKVRFDDGDDKPDASYGSDAEAIAAFDAAESEWMQRGYARWEFELEPDLGKPAKKPSKSSRRR